jgi:3',5'-cyclic AMP phosphodiesterase CpdA
MIVQLTDPHLGAPWSQSSVQALTAAVASVRSILPKVPDAVIVTGDIAEPPTETAYQKARAALDELGAPVYVQPGNDDDRDALRRHFDFPGTHGKLLNYVAELGPIRMVALDTKRQGSAGGQLDQATLKWLEATLAAERTTPTLLAMHHPPLLTGLPSLDSISIPECECLALGEPLSSHQQVQLIAAGHVHRTVIGRLGATPVLAIPSTDLQIALDFEDPDLHFLTDPPCFAVHIQIDRTIVSHVHAIPGRAP